MIQYNKISITIVYMFALAFDSTPVFDVFFLHKAADEALFIELGMLFEELLVTFVTDPILFIRVSTILTAKFVNICTKLM